MSRVLLFPAVLLCVLMAYSCKQDPPLPKPRAYPRIHFPERSPQSYSVAGCPFAFEYPSYARIVSDTAQAPCWFDLYIPEFDCRLYCSYYPIDQGSSLEALKADAFDLADWHNKRANYIEETPIQIGADIRGLMFSMDGPSATPFQFFLTDERRHFFRGALYFNTTINPDSLAPLYTFVRTDVDRLIQSFEWKK